MKLWLFSDLHLPDDTTDITSVLSRIPDADVCVVAGDLLEGRPDDAVRWLDACIALVMPVVYVLGNHEFHDSECDMTRARELTQRAAYYTYDRVRVLDDAAVTIGGMRFIGSTLWYDLQLYGADHASMAEAWSAADRMPDSSYMLDAGHRWTPGHARRQHLQSRAWLDTELGASTLPTVVITHHAPHPRSIAAQYASDAQTPAFVSDLGELIERHRPALWVHGHTHTSFDYRVGGTRVVCNPRGMGRENERGFDPGLVLDLA